MDDGKLLLKSKSVTYNTAGQVSEGLHTIKRLQDREQLLTGRLDLLKCDLKSAEAGHAIELENHWQAEDEILQLQGEMEQTTTQLVEADERVKTLQANLNNLRDENAELEDRWSGVRAKLDNAESSLASLQSDLGAKSRQVLDLEADVSKHQEDLKSARDKGTLAVEQLAAEKARRQNLESKVDKLEEELKDADGVAAKFKELESLLKDCMADLAQAEEDRKIAQEEVRAERQRATRLEGELGDEESFKAKYEALAAMIEPFREQLESYRAEREALLSRNMEAHGELKKLATQHAQLMGHQNHKQKIQHLVKLKRENLELREEASGLRRQLDRYKQMALNKPKLMVGTPFNKENNNDGRAMFDASSMDPEELVTPLKAAFSSSQQRSLIRRQTIASPLSSRNRAPRE